MFLYNSFEEVFKRIAELDDTGVRELLFSDVPWGWKRGSRGYLSGVANFCSRRTRRVLRAKNLMDFHHKEKLDINWYNSFREKINSLEDEQLSAIVQELRESLRECNIPSCFSEKQNECTATKCVFTHFMMCEGHEELIGDPVCFCRQRKLVLDKADDPTFLYYALMFSIRWQNMRNKMESVGYSFDDAIEHKALINDAKEGSGASGAKTEDIVRGADFLRLCGICGDDSGVEDVLASDSMYSQKNSIERIDSRSKFKFMASGGAKGWILRDDVRELLITRLEHLEARNIKQHVKFLIVHPCAEFYDKVKHNNNPKMPPCPDCYRMWHELMKRFTCLEVRLYQRRTFRLQIEKDRVLVSRYEEEIKKGKPAIVVWDSVPKTGAWIENSLYRSFEMLFDFVWDMETTCSLSDFFEKQDGERILCALEDEFDY